MSILIFKLATSSHKTWLEHFLFFGAADQFGPIFLLCLHGQNKVLLLLVTSALSLLLLMRVEIRTMHASM
jgi:hypothetical protein